MAASHVTVEMRRILGVDPGTAVTGWGVLEVAGADLKHVASGVIRVPGRLDRAGSLGFIQEGIGELLERHRPGALSLERAFVARNVQSAFRIGEVRGVVFAAAARAGVPVFEYAPATIKKIVVGNGRATKDQMIRGVSMLLALGKTTSADEADALAIATCHAREMRRETALREAR